MHKTREQGPIRAPSLALLTNLEPGFPYFRANACNWAHSSLPAPSHQHPASHGASRDDKLPIVFFFIQIACCSDSKSSTKWEDWKDLFQRIGTQGLPQLLAFQGTRNMWQETKNTLKHDLVLISRLPGIKIHRTLEKYSVILLFSLVSKDNVHFPTLSF